MGQYYKPAILNDKNEVVAWLNSHDYDNGLKLMEHSWISNSFVNAFIALLFDEQIKKRAGVEKNAPLRVVWAGDYADPEPHKCITPDKYNCCEESRNIYQLCEDTLREFPQALNFHETHPYIVNHSKREYVDLREVNPEPYESIHPLPLLTCEGNGRGGGDFKGADPDKLIGRWARDLTSVESIEPTEYTKINFGLQE